MTERNEALKELGRVAAERRESKGMTLEDVFDRTRIRLEYLKGIEEGDYKNFPEVVYIKGFIRTYLKLIDAEDLQNDFMNQLDRTQNPKRHEQNVNNVLKNSSSMPEGFKPASHFWLFLVLVCALLGTGAYAWYAFASGHFDLSNFKPFNFKHTISQDFQETQNLSSGDLNENSGDNVELVSEDKISEDKQPEPELKPSIEVRAINDVWLSVTIGTEKVFGRTLKRGESISFELTAQARVNFGRPTVAQVILNGKDLGVINPRAKRPETYIFQQDGTFRKAGRN